jgi:hypothetical protein
VSSLPREIDQSNDVAATLLYSNCGVFLSVILALLSVIFLIPEIFLLSRIVGAALSTLNFGAFALFMTVGLQKPFSITFSASS